MTPRVITGPGVTFRRCQWCGEDFDGYQDEPYHEDCAPKAAAVPLETPWWQKRRTSTRRRLGGLQVQTPGGLPDGHTH